MPALTKRFSKNASLEDYELFAKTVSRNKTVNFLTVYINPVLWNKASRFLKRRSFEEVDLYPLRLSYMGFKCWVPRCQVCRSGFLDETYLVSMSSSGNYYDGGIDDGGFDFLRLVNHDTENPAPLPFIEERERFVIKLHGLFSYLERLPPGLSTLEVHDMQLTVDQLKTVSGISNTLDISKCTLEDECMDCTIR